MPEQSTSIQEIQDRCMCIFSTTRMHGAVEKPTRKRPTRFHKFRKDADDTACILHSQEYSVLPRPIQADGHHAMTGSVSLMRSHT